ncbi:hypothetical protein EVAR_90110_1 [Eumeta japonica]|uniref:RNA-directed DNA polymerase from mobile element jockey n=1 Tax=Eumeta variegata TaxID=151549 RepID=A0A4C1X245_EUMVA|nr:hypothetical protein EVAR_90110_1 [Eumeta japonica]
MTILRTVKSSEISNSPSRACSNVEEKLMVLVRYHHLMGKLSPYKCLHPGVAASLPQLKKCMSENSIDIALVQEHILNRIRPKACSIAAMSNLNGRTYSSKGVLLCTTDAPYIAAINIPPLTNMEAMGCRLAMTGHEYTRHSLGLSPVSKAVAPARPKSPLCLGDAVILFGDFNCKNIRWGCLSNNYNGIKLDELEDRLDFGIIAPSTSTCFSHVVT